MTNDAPQTFTITSDTPGVLIEWGEPGSDDGLQVWKVSQVAETFFVLSRDGQVMTIQNINKYEEEA